MVGGRPLTKKTENSVRDWIDRYMTVEKKKLVHRKASSTANGPQNGPQLIPLKMGME